MSGVNDSGPLKNFLIPDFSRLGIRFIALIKYEDINCEIDPLTECIDLGDIISEELYLAIPKYPKKEGVKLEQIYNNEEDTELNPFQKLERLKF